LRSDAQWRIILQLRFAIIGLILALVSTLAVATQGPPAHARVAPALARDGRTSYVIALAGDAIPAEARAARELAEYLHQITGATFAVRPEAQVPAAAPQILVGAGTRVRRLLPRQDWAALGEDGIVLKTFGRKLVLAGGRPRGTLYAVYQFLEGQAGVRWWTPTEGTVPHRRTLRLPLLDVAYTPPFRYREHHTTSVLRDPLFATRLRENGHSQKQGEELGGHYSILGGVHTFDQLLPPAKYFKEHPEWYSDAYNGGKPSTALSREPAPQTSQLCLANEAARRELTRVALEWIRKNPGAGMISISQNDSRNRCTSDADLALEEREGSPAGPLLHFVNAVAAEIEKEFPDFLVETLAYKYTRKPPRHVRPRHNVLVRLCSIEADFSTPLASESNREYLADLEGWKAIAPHLYVWDYVTNFANGIWPHPNLRVLGPNLRLFAASNVSGVFEQGDAFTNGVGDFVQLRAWLVSHLMWNPQQDERKLTAEFLRGYYGAAAPHLRAYLDLIHEAFLRSGQRLGADYKMRGYPSRGLPWWQQLLSCHSGRLPSYSPASEAISVIPKWPLSTFQTDHAYLTLEVMNQATRHFRDAAQAVAGDPVLARRVRRERLALDHVWVVHYRAYQRAAQAAGERFEGPPDAAAAAAEFVRTAQAFGVEYHREDQSFAAYAPQLLRRYRAAAPLPAALEEAVRGKDANDIIDAQDDVLHYHTFQLGTLVDLVDDAKASDGKAARMTGATDQWATRYVLEEDARVLAHGPWHAYVVVRVEPKAGADEQARKSRAVMYGLYDVAAKVSPVQAGHTLGEIGDNEYHVVDLGRQALRPGMYFYVAPASNPGVEAVYVDRVVLVRERSEAR